MIPSHTGPYYTCPLVMEQWKAHHFSSMIFPARNLHLVRVFFSIPTFDCGRVWPWKLCTPWLVRVCWPWLFWDKSSPEPGGTVGIIWMARHGTTAFKLSSGKMMKDYRGIWVWKITMTIPSPQVTSPTLRIADFQRNRFFQAPAHGRVRHVSCGGTLW